MDEGTDKKQGQAHADRDHELSNETRRQRAQPSAETEEALIEASHQSDLRREVWENEGGAL